jgi:hypothetical protein
VSDLVGSAVDVDLGAGDEAALAGREEEGALRCLKAGVTGKVWVPALRRPASQGELGPHRGDEAFVGGDGLRGLVAFAR